MTGTETKTAAQRMQRRHETINAAKEQYKELPEPNREVLEYEFQRANDEARKVLRRK